MPRQNRRESAPSALRPSAVLGAIGRIISRHPSIAAGLSAMAVTFGYFTLNAMHQPEKHPSPWFVTREVAKPEARFPVDAPVPDSRVTTFRIERSDPQSTASIRTRQESQVDNTVFHLQRLMHERGIFAGPVNGVPGPQTETAIRFYQLDAGLDPTGEPSGTLLAHMLLRDLATVPVPRSRPATAPAASAESPIWRRARSAPEAADRPLPSAITDRDLVIDIQRGLSNIAYADIEVDGIVGTQTRTAIADFQKHYRLPVTGKPDQAVLDKLREIGAL